MTLAGAGGRMPKRKMQNARPRIRITWKNRERRKPMRYFRVRRKLTRSVYSLAVSVWPNVGGITPGGKPATVPIPRGSRIFFMMKKILDPRGMGTVAGFPPGVMPPTFGQTLTAKEYTDLVSFLLTLK